MENIFKGLTIFNTALTFINSVTKIIGFNEQSWFEIIAAFISFIVCKVILTEAKKYLKEKEEVEEYFECY